jgi:hypothetical protein
MPAILLPWVTRLLPYLIGLFIFFGAFFYVRHIEDALHTAQAEMVAEKTTISTLQQANQQNLAALAHLQKQQAEWDGEMLVVQQNDHNQLTAAQQIDKEINAASPAQNGAAAPVLAATLDAIERMQVGKR